jgi:hypothetical protein
MRRNQQVTIYALAVLLISCQPKQVPVGAPVPEPLAEFSQALAVAESGVAETALTLMELEQAKLVKREEIAPIVDAVKRAAKAGAQTAKALKGLKALSDADRKNLAKLMAPMTDSLSEALDRHILNLGADAQVKVKALLAALVSTIKLTQAILVVR